MYFVLDTATRDALIALCELHGGHPDPFPGPDRSTFCFHRPGDRLERLVTITALHSEAWQRIEPSHVNVVTMVREFVAWSQHKTLRPRDPSWSSHDPTTGLVTPEQAVALLSEFLSG